MRSILFVAAMLTAQPAFAQVQIVSEPTRKKPSAPPKRTYADAYRDAQAANRPLVIFVDCGLPKYLTPPAYDTWYSSAGDWWDLAKSLERGVIVSVDGWRGKMLPPGSSTAEINDEVFRLIAEVKAEERQVSQQARPFSGPRYRETLLYGLEAGNLQIADGSRGGPVGPWPAGVPFIRGLQAYKPAKLTQRSFDRELFGYASGWIQPISRYTLPSKWHQPGGLEGITGWRSDLYKLLPYAETHWRGKTNVQEAFPPAAFQRAYPDGTLFVDALSKEGKVFELRAREKADGVWHSYVAFRDKRNRPAGYHGLRGQTCFECHSEAGQGKYGSGYIIGGDTVLSDPLKGLESP